ncbi:hypothetical protein PMKS-000937 [Pichia membranifaciens]|uniref:Uncharacterized protein n=1 Tax=Pichia membranifaciens TaxID=4926 RepID=A0A1Q2YD55_9ASCO|nr:hypothetical protein PMKS-000937 [Pichia membranifaciens]
MLAASALEKLKSDKSLPATPVTNLSRTPSPSAKLQVFSAPAAPKPTIFDKMISHPLISNSINYVLEKTINSSNNNILQEDNSNSALPSIDSIIPNKELPKFPCDANKSDSNLGSVAKKRARDLESIDPLDASHRNKKIKATIAPLLPTLPNRDVRFRKKNGRQNLRQQIAISSAVSAQKSLQDLKHLSSLNLNIESRKRLTMLIHFLKLGSSQLSERIDNLIQSVDEKRQKLSVKSGFSGESRSNSEPDINIQQIKSDIVTTVKKIVNVVSKVSAQSLSEPARSNVREALLKLPTNWATMLNNEPMFSVGVDDEYDFNSEEDEEEDEEDDEDDEDEDDFKEAQESRIGSPSPTSMSEENSRSGEIENIPTMTVNNQTIFQRKRKPSISRRLLTSLLRYRKTKGGGLEQNTLKLKKWFREKIKDQIMHDSSGKVLILAQESLDMVNKITKFCNESLDKAEHWNNDRQQQHQIELLKRLQQINGLNLSAVPNKGKEEIIETMVVKENATTTINIKSSSAEDDVKTS